MASNSSAPPDPRRTQAALRRQSKGTHRAQIREVTPGAYLPEARVKDNALDGVQGEIIYPTVGLHLYKVADATLVAAWLRRLQRLDCRVLQRMLG